MPMYPYMIPTTVLGYAYPYDSETNVSTVQPPGSCAFLHVPSPSTIDARRAYIVVPVLSAGKLQALNGTFIDNSLQAGEIGKTNTGAPIFLGNPVNDTDMDISDKKGLMYMKLPGLPIPVLVIIVLLVVFGLIAGMFIGNVAQQIKEYHALDVALELQKYTDQYLDVDTGRISSTYFDGADIIIRTYNNGELLYIAMNDRGEEYLNGELFTVVKEGIDTDALLDDIFNRDNWMQIIQWAVIGAIAIAGVYVAVKLFTRRGGQPQYYPPPPSYPSYSQYPYPPPTPV